MGKLPKIFVLDTNIILHDFRCIHRFQDNDLVIPMAVLEELDKFKKGNDALSYNARGFMREIDRLTTGRNFGKEGVPLGKGQGDIKVEVNHPFPEELAKCFVDDIQDHRILSTAMWVRDNNPGRFTALVTKDVNLRMKAKSVGMAAQDYLTDKLGDDNIDGTLHRDIIYVDDVDPAKLHELAYGSGSVAVKDILDVTPKPNQLYRFFWTQGDGKHTVCARYNAASERLQLIRKQYASGIGPRNDEQKMALDACLNPDIKLVSLTGGAGTGKTLLALAAAIEQANAYDQIILTRPTVILGNQEIGFLPGDQKSKMSPFIQPLMDNLGVIKGSFKPGSRQAEKIDAMLDTGKLEISPLAYIRGRSLSKVYFIVDEAQNLTPHEVKTIITRAGEGTKIVFTGDIYQIDAPYLDQWSNGLSHLNDKMSGQAVFCHINLTKGERSELSDLAAKLL